MILLCDLVPNLRKLFHIRIQKFYDVVSVCHADLLPHYGRRGGNAGDVLKASCCNGMHDGILGIGMLHQIDETCRDDVRKVGNPGNRIVVKGTGNDKRNGFDALYERLKAFRLLLRCFVCGRHNVVCIFQKRRTGVVIAGSLRACHGMTSDEKGGEPFSFYLLLNVSFGGADIGQNGGRLQMSLQCGKIFRVLPDRSTEKNNVAVFKQSTVKRAVFAAGTGIDDSVMNGLVQRVTGRVIGDDLRHGPVASNRLCNRTSDQAKTDKAKTEGVKIRHNQSPRISAEIEPAKGIKIMIEMELAEWI